jgi:hypothetical protein
VQYALEISEHNAQAHLDIEEAIQKQKNGLFTFILRINNGNIVDFNLVYVTDARDYLKLTEVVVEELTLARSVDIGNKQNTIRSDNSERND